MTEKTEWGNFYTVEQAVNEAFEFYAANPEYGYSGRFSKGSYDRLWSMNTIKIQHFANCQIYRKI